MNLFTSFVNPSSINKNHKISSIIPIYGLSENYKVISALGVGSFGTVMLAKILNGKEYLRKYNSQMYGTLLEPLNESNENKSPLVAVKILNKKSSLKDYCNDREVRFILSMPAHPSLVQVYEIFIDAKDFKLHIIMESLNQTLLQLMTARRNVKFSEKTLKSILSQVLAGIKHIHKYEYFHRDIKPENILVIPTIQYYGFKENIPSSRKHDNYIIKLADYGLSRSLNTMTPYTSYISTRWYRAPEILLRRKWHSRSVDIWAFGVVAVELVNFLPLFPGSSELDQLSRILNVLGCPCLPDVNSFNNYTHYQQHIDISNDYNYYFVPLGGFWKEAAMLGSRLGIRFPYEQGVAISDILPINMYGKLHEVIKLCLTWDPDTRADTNLLSSMEYFNGTQVYEPYSPINLGSKSLSSFMSPYGSNKQLVQPSISPLPPVPQHGSTRSSPTLNRPVPLHPYQGYSFEPNYVYEECDDGYENQFMKFNLQGSKTRSNHHKPSKSLDSQDDDYLLENEFIPNEYLWKTHNIDNITNAKEYDYLLDLSEPTSIPPSTSNKSLSNDVTRVLV